MAKSWKKLLSNDDKSIVEADLEQSFKDLLQIDDTLKDLIKEREDLENQIKSLSGASDADSQPLGKTFDQPVDSFQTKRKKDSKQFEAKRKLEEKIALKKRAFEHWENKRDKLRAKVQKTERLLKKAKSLKDDYPKDDFEAVWQEKRDAFRDGITKKPKDSWSLKRDIKKTLISSKIKTSIFRKPSSATKLKPKVKKVKEQWGKVRDKKREAQKLKAKGDKKWDDIQKKSIIDSFEVIPKEAKEELKQFEDGLKKTAQKEKDHFEEKQQKLKDRLKSKLNKPKNSVTNKKKKEQKEAKREEQVAEKRERNRTKRQAQLRAEKKQERNSAQRREQRKEERRNRKKDKYA